jgi:hypothetical protein
VRIGIVELLLGPTFATSKVLQEMNLKLSDIGVVEFHEAFAGTYAFVLIFDIGAYVCLTMWMI